MERVDISFVAILGRNGGMCLVKIFVLELCVSSETSPSIVGGTGRQYDHETSARASNWAEQQQLNDQRPNRGGGTTYLLLLFWQPLSPLTGLCL
jgi:hypothetical protein